MDAHGIRSERTCRPPQVDEILSWEIRLDAMDHPRPPPGFIESHYRDDKASNPNQEELQNLIEDCRE